MIISAILNIFYSMLLTMLVLYVLFKITNSSIDTKKKIIFVISFGIVSSGCSYVNVAIKQIILAITFIEFSHRYLKIDYYKAMMSGILGLIFISTGDLFAGVILNSIAGFSASEIRNNPLLSILVYIIIGTTVVFITNVFQKLNHILGVDEEYNIKNSMVSIAYILIIMVFEGVLAKIYELIPGVTNRIYIIAFFILTIMFTVINFVVLYVNKRYITQKNEYEHLKIYTGVVENLVSDIRKFRHDYVNIISSIGGYIETEDIPGLTQYFKNEIVKESRILYDNNNMLELQKIKNPAIKGLVSSKIVHAENLGINLNVEIESEINDTNIKTIDMCRILGIILDNGIETAEESTEKIMNIGMMDDKENVVFLITNTYKDLPKISDIFTNGFSTKGENRGIGLSTVKSIIDNDYNNILLNTFVENGVFKMEINIMRTKKMAV